MKFKSSPEKEPVDQEPIQLVCQLYKVSTTRDGGSRLVLDCGAESLEGIQEIQRLSAAGDISLAVAVVPFV